MILLFLLLIFVLITSDQTCVKGGDAEGDFYSNYACPSCSESKHTEEQLLRRSADE